MYMPWVEVDLKKVRSNVEKILSSFSNGVESVFVVKADAYGHGLVEFVKAAYQAGARWFAVVSLIKAEQIRELFPDAKVVILGVSAPEDVETLYEKKLLTVVANLEHGLALAESARNLGITLDVHLKVDTGMGRLGVLANEVESVVEVLTSVGGLNFTGICSHFARVEAVDNVNADAQVELFKNASEKLEKRVGHPVFKYISSSRASWLFDKWDFDGVRPGIAIYGYGTDSGVGRFHTVPVLQWKTRVAQVKRMPANYPIGYYGTYVTKTETFVATIAVGYADGYNRALSNKGSVLIGGKRCPVIGRVSMNWVTVDLGPETDVKVGDEVVLIGEQGNESIWASELAKICVTIPYEILTSINQQVPRHYV